MKDQESDYSEFSIPDSDVPDVLLAYADGIVEHIKDKCPGVQINRINNHDLQVIGSRSFAPLLLLQTSEPSPILLVKIGSDYLEFCSSCLVNLNNDAHFSAHYTLDYSNPDLLQHLIETVFKYFGEDDAKNTRNSFDS